MLLAKHISLKIKNAILLDDVSADFMPGKFNLIIGPNGAGKTTFIKILCGQLMPHQGEVHLNNVNLRNFSHAELAKVRAVLSQNVELAFPLTVSEIVMMGRYPHFSIQPSSTDISACEEAMRFFNVTELHDRNYMTLSGGEKQRVNFARVMAQIWFPTKNGNRYLILDEPLTFLDVRYQFDFMNKLSSLLSTQNDLVVVGVVHDLNQAAKFADYIMLISQGKVLVQGEKEVVLTPENIKAAYQIDSVVHTEKGGMHILFK